ncbi:MAG: DUF493 domain-containing protein [Gammaproteobacteria bacterium]|nr:DUF493 domain-containing protein [Gammaproteobacteria bacterium]
MLETESSLLTFPSAFPIKVMGHAADDFAELVIEIVLRHVRELGEGAVESRPSRQGKYLSLTVTVEVDSQAQLDRLYRELSTHTRILMVL